MSIVQPKVVLLNPEEVANALQIVGDFARVCYDSFGEAENIALHCMDSGHTTPWRAVKVRFAITGVSRSFSHQHVRHNTGITHNQRSQRFVVEDNFGYIVPPKIASDMQALAIYESFMEVAQHTFNELMELDVPAEDAREVLPNGCETRINTAFDIPALIHYCHDRLCTRAQWQIRNIAKMMKAEIATVNPTLAKYLVSKCEALGYCPEKKKKKDDCGLRPTKQELLSIYNLHKK